MSVLLIKRTNMFTKWLENLQNYASNFKIFECLCYLKPIWTKWRPYLRISMTVILVTFPSLGFYESSDSVLFKLPNKNQLTQQMFPQVCCIVEISWFNMTSPATLSSPLPGREHSRLPLSVCKLRVNLHSNSFHQLILARRKRRPILRSETIYG